VFVLSDNYLHLLSGFSVKEDNPNIKFFDLTFEWIPPQSFNSKGEVKTTIPTEIDEMSDDVFVRYVWNELLSNDMHVKFHLEEVCAAP
jgi:hypothetical protein